MLTSQRMRIKVVKLVSVVALVVREYIDKLNIKTVDMAMAWEAPVSTDTGSCYHRSRPIE